MYGVEGPSTPEDSTAHLVTARFCSGGSASAEQAVFQLDLPAWGRGKCKVVALDPADSASVLESNEVTFNGGVADDYAPVLLAATSTHPGELLTVEGSGHGSGPHAASRMCGESAVRARLWWDRVPRGRAVQRGYVIPRLHQPLH